MKIHQDASVYAGLFDGTERAEHVIAPGRRSYVHVVRGDIVVNGEALGAGDAARIEDAPSIVLERAKDAEVLLFDLP